MGYKVLLTGSLQSAIDDFFIQMDDSVTCITTSIRSSDILRHIHIFQPDIFVLCLRNETPEIMKAMYEIKKECTKYDVVFAALGDKDVCNEFARIAINVADLYLVKPITNSMILANIQEYFEERDEERKRIAWEKKAAALKSKMEEKAARKHILIVDDDANMLRTLKAQLEDRYNVATAINGSLALRFLLKKKTDLILLDYEMPGQDGAQILGALRGNEETREIPVVFLTGVSDTDKIKKVLAMKPQGYLLKPVEHEKLMAMIGKILEGNE